MSFKKRNRTIPPCPKGSSEQCILGRYYENWYLDGGRASHEIVTQWYDFPDAEI